MLSRQWISAREGLPVLPGVLDGLTIMRYAHVYRDRASGGIEQYVRLVNHGLLQRHRMTILQMHLAKDEGDNAIETENVGIGRILWVPVDFCQADRSISKLGSRIGYIFRRSARMSQRMGQAPLRAVFLSIQRLASHRGAHLRYGAIILSDPLRSLMGTHKVNLLALHWLSYDTGALISHARKTGIPFVFINHHDNTRLSLPKTRKWITHAAAIGIVSDCAVPPDLRNRCINLSDAVDTEFFTPEKARAVRFHACPVVLLPARIAARKGHRDLIEATCILAAQHLDFIVCFAGAVDSESLHQELRSYARATGLDARFVFLGEISAEEIRDWYGISSVIVLPSHSEGLGRVLIEAQAMKKPVVAYDTGGVSESILPDATGFLVERGNVKALAEKIRYLLENEAERMRMGERGRDFVSREFSASALIQRHEDFYVKSLCGIRGKRNAG